MFGVDGGQRQAIDAAEQDVGILEHGAHPPGGGDDLGHADAAITVAVEHLQRAGVELQPRGRAGEHGPQFLVQFAEMAQIVRGLDADLIEATGAEEPPLVALLALFFIAHCCSLSGKIPIARA